MTGSCQQGISSEVPVFDINTLSLPPLSLCMREGKWESGKVPSVKFLKSQLSFDRNCRNQVYHKNEIREKDLNIFGDVAGSWGLSR